MLWVTKNVFLNFRCHPHQLFFQVKTTQLNIGLDLNFLHLVLLSILGYICRFWRSNIINAGIYPYLFWFFGVDYAIQIIYNLLTHEAHHLKWYSTDTPHIYIFKMMTLDPEGFTCHTKYVTNSIVGIPNFGSQLGLPWVTLTFSRIYLLIPSCH